MLVVTLFVFWVAAICNFALHNLGFERCIFLEQYTMGPVFGLFNFER